MGLKKTFQIGRIVIHPKNPNIVYVGALGRLYGPNEERGLFKTTDGGKTWEKVLFVDDKTGVIDMQMHPTDPETLLVATWERQRDGFDSPSRRAAVADGYDAYDPIKKWGPGGRPLQDHRRRQDVQEAHQGPAHATTSAASASTITARTRTRLRHHRLPRRSAWARRPRPATVCMGISARTRTRACADGVRENGPPPRPGCRSTTSCNRRRRSISTRATERSDPRAQGRRQGEVQGPARRAGLEIIVTLEPRPQPRAAGGAGGPTSAWLAKMPKKGRQSDRRGGRRSRGKKRDLRADDIDQSDRTTSA